MIRAALYARYSSDRQNERSIEDQLAQCSRLAGARGWVVVASFADAAISGAAMANRPGLNAALEAAGRREFDVLLTEDEDRIARNLEHQAHVFNRLRDLGVSIATMSSESIGIMEVGLKGLWRRAAALPRPTIADADRLANEYGLTVSGPDGDGLVWADMVDPDTRVAAGILLGEAGSEAGKAWLAWRDRAGRPSG